MSSVSGGTTVIVDKDGGDAVTVTDSRLDVNAAITIASDTIDIGDVSLLLDGTAADYGTGNVNTSGRTLRVTLASDDVHFGTVGTAEDIDGTIHGQLRYLGAKLASIDGDTTLIRLNTSILAGVGMTFGTNTYTEAVTSGFAFGGIRNDALESLVNTDNEFAPLQINEDGALYVTGESKHDSAVTDYGIGIMAEAKTIDGSSLPNSTAEGDAIRIAATRGGVLYSCLTDGTGQIAHPNATDDSPQDSNPGMLNVGGEYRSGSYTYSDGDATILQTNVNGALEVVGTVDLGSTDNAVLDAMVVDLAAMEALLITIDSDTDAIKTAVEIIDNAIDGSEMQVDVVAALPAGDNNIGNVDIVTMPASTNTIEVVGDVAENENAAGNPVLIGGRYDTSARTLGNTDVGALALNASGHVLMDVVNGGVLETLLDGVETLLGAPASTSSGSNIIGRVGHDITGGGQGKKVTTGAGDHIVLGGDVDCKKIDIQAQTDNTGLIAVGFNTVDATEATGDGIILYAGDTYSLEVNNLNLIYIDSTVTGDGVRYTYFTQWHLIV